MPSWNNRRIQNDKRREEFWRSIIEERELERERQTASGQPEPTQPEEDYRFQSQTRQRKGCARAWEEILADRNSPPVSNDIPPTDTKAAGEYEALQRLREAVLGHRF
jgi:hypothetical protein